MTIQGNRIGISEIDLDAARGKTLIIKIDVNADGTVKAATKTTIKSEA